MGPDVLVAHRGEAAKFRSRCNRFRSGMFVRKSGSFPGDGQQSTLGSSGAQTKTMGGAHGYVSATFASKRVSKMYRARPAVAGTFTCCRAASTGPPLDQQTGQLA